MGPKPLLVGGSYRELNPHLLSSHNFVKRNDEVLTECEHDQDQKSPETRWPDLIMDLDSDLWNLHAFEHETHDNDG